MKIKINKIIYRLAAILWICLFLIQPAFCEPAPDIEQRIKALEQEAGSKKTGIQKILTSLTLSGAIELDYSYSDDSDVTDRTKNDATSDLDIGTIELGIEGNFNYVTANILLKGENLDSDSTIFWDEVFFTFQKKDMPVYFVGGKRPQPFGAFESLFINDPITQDLYEINKTGATIGFAKKEMLNLDLSVTLYKGEALTNRISETEYGWTRDTSPGYESTNDASSFILSASFAPVEGMGLAAYYNSEPGDAERNTTLGSSFHWEISNFIVDAEYIGALTREIHATDKREYTESAWFTSLGYQLMAPMVIAMRYENFDADREQDGNLDYRYGVAADYTLFTTNGVACNLMGEFRRVEYNTTANTVVDSNANEFFARIALSF